MSSCVVKSKESGAQGKESKERKKDSYVKLACRKLARKPLVLFLLSLSSGPDDHNPSHNSCIFLHASDINEKCAPRPLFFCSPLKNLHPLDPVQPKFTFTTLLPLPTPSFFFLFVHAFSQLMLVGTKQAN